MNVTPTKGDGEGRWSSGSRWDGGAEGETSAMDGLGRYCPGSGCGGGNWTWRSGRKSKIQGCLRKTDRTDESLVRVPQAAAGIEICWRLPYFNVTNLLMIGSHYQAQADDRLQNTNLTRL